jgi:hypothetical protein
MKAGPEHFAIKLPLACHGRPIVAAMTVQAIQPDNELLQR